MELDLLSNPFALILGGMVLLLVLYFWNKSNSNKARHRRQRNFRKSYQERRKEKDEK